MKNSIYIFFSFFFLISCEESFIPKPKSYLSLQYPNAQYHRIKTDCPYSFEISNVTTFKKRKKCWASIRYPKLKATLHITYREVHNNLPEILKEVEKLTFKHTIKADAIVPKAFENKQKNIYATLYNVEGNVATNIQFKATDSTKNVLAGALYFDVKPNYDSILPAITYIKKDIIHLIESVSWK